MERLFRFSDFNHLRAFFAGGCFPCEAWSLLVYSERICEILTPQVRGGIECRTACQGEGGYSGEYDTCLMHAG